jgi:hypothetical protein
VFPGNAGRHEKESKHGRIISLTRERQIKTCFSRFRKSTFKKGNKNMELLFKNYDSVLLFTGTDQEREAAEKCYEYNEQLKQKAYNMVLSGNCLFAYIDNMHKNGRLSRLVLHKSAKYECLQLTCLNYENGDFLYPVYDCSIDNYNKFSFEFSGGERIIIE